MGGIKTISRQRMIGDGNCLNVWIEDIKENKLCPSGISKLAGVSSRVMTGGVDTSPVRDVT
jgi:hypothetical protein